MIVIQNLGDIHFLTCFLSSGHGGSDGLHGYVPSLDYVVEDTVRHVLFCPHAYMYKHIY